MKIILMIALMLSGMLMQAQNSKLYSNCSSAENKYDVWAPWKDSPLIEIQVGYDDKMPSTIFIKDERREISYYIKITGIKETEEKDWFELTTFKYNTEKIDNRFYAYNATYAVKPYEILVYVDKKKRKFIINIWWSDKALGYSGLYTN